MSDHRSIISAHKNSEGEFNFHLNNLLNSMRPFHYLISHFPCSYRCRKSINFSKSLLKHMKKYDQKLTEIIINNLKKYVLYFNLRKLIVFDGRKIKNKIFINDIIFCKGIRNKEVYTSDSLKRKENKIIFYNKENPTCILKNENNNRGLLFSFS